jgi:hypothetical protein
MVAHNVSQNKKDGDAILFVLSIRHKYNTPLYDNLLTLLFD